jgi:hypothetical protein
MSSPWVIYEDTARKVLADMRNVLGISGVEGKQTLHGNSLANWEIDAKAWVEGSEGFLIVEARRHTTSRLTQESLAAIGYRIKDVGGSGGIVVTPLPLQKGAMAVATKEGIAHVRLSAESTTESYLAEFLGRKFIGASVAETANLLDSCDATVIRAIPNET